MAMDQPAFVNPSPPTNPLRTMTRPSLHRPGQTDGANRADPDHNARPLPEKRQLVRHPTSNCLKVRLKGRHQIIGSFSPTTDLRIALSSRIAQICNAE